MKTLSTLKKLAAVSVCVLASAVSSHAANIVWVSFHAAENTPSANAATAGFTNAPDAAYTQLLRSAGHNVTRVVTMDNAAVNTNLINSADLVIVSRSAPSGHYQATNETAFWNNIVTAPLMHLGGYLIRGGTTAGNVRLGYVTSSTIPDVTNNPVRLRVNDPSHPIFAGVSLDASNLMVSPYANIAVFTNNLQQGISVILGAPAGSGRVLATIGTTNDPAFGGLVIAEWQRGSVLDTAGRGGGATNDIVGGHRLVFLTGSRERTITAEGAGIFDLTPEGARMFLNAVNYMAPPPQSAPYPATVLAQNPIVYYRFNDAFTAPAPDVATNLGGLTTGNGVYVNCPTHPQPGAIVGSADTSATFDGQSQSVDVPFSDVLNPAGPFTVEVWANLTGFTNFNRTAVASRWATGVQQGYQLQVRNTGGNNSWRFTTYNGTGANNLEYTGNQEWNIWVHVVAVHDGSVNRLYTNGVLAATSAAVTYVANNNPGSVFRIGGSWNETSGYWRGGLDEVAVYNVALTDAQILAHYQNGTNSARATPYEQAVLADTPVGYWRLNEPAGPPCPVAVNSGARGAAANANYFGAAAPGPEAPRSPVFFGFETNNTAAQFNGSNAIVAGVSGLLNGMPRFTISGWFRRETDQAARTGLWGQNDIVEVGYIDNNTIQTWTDNGLNVTPNPIPNGEWAHFAIVSENSPGVIRAYTNGVFAVQRNHTLPVTNAFRFSIGGGGVFDPSRNFFNGQIDEVAVFDRALTAEQISSQYFSTVAAPPVITRQPQGTNMFAGGTLRLEVGVAGSPPLSFQWLNFGTAVAGGTNAVLLITNANTLDSGTYTVTVTNAFGSVDSAAVEVVINPPAFAIPPGRVVAPPATAAGTGLKGEYWKRPPVSIPTDGATNPTNRIDRLINTFGPPNGTFDATRLSYTGNDLTLILTWLTNDAPSFVGTTNNLDDGAVRFRGYINVSSLGPINIGTTSDDGSRITIAGIDVINNDGSHGDVTMDTNIHFTAVGLYPIEITYFNGDWTSDGTGTNLNHSGNPDPAVHGGANFHLRVNGATVNATTIGLFHMTAPVVEVPSGLAITTPPAVPGGNLKGEYWKRPPVSIPTDGITNPSNRIDVLIRGFGPPDGMFTATRFSYTGNDLTPVLTWLATDAPSFVGQANNFDDGAIRFIGFLNVTNPGPVRLGTTSDDGSRITIGGVDVINNDGSHGDVTIDTNVNFTAAGLYPIEITYFNGDWTSDGTGTNLNHSGNPDPAVHGGANFHLRVNGATITPADVASLFPPEAVGGGGGEMRLSIARTNSVVALSWTGGGTLQEAREITGPWRDSANQANPQNVGTENFLVHLNPAQEDPNPGTRSGVGNGVISLIGTNMLRINITFSGLSGTFAADHIHGPAGRGTNAGVLYDLGGLTTVSGTNGTITGTVTLAAGTGGFTLAQQLDQLRQGLWYVNIHTSPTFGGGEIRGQIDPVRFSVSMDPLQEPGTTGNTGQGQGLVALNGTALTVNLSFSGLRGTVNNAHYHGPAVRGTNTGVIYGLVPFTTMGSTSGTMRGSVTLTNGARGFTIAEQLDQLNRGLWYLNIHTTNFPGGEIRGQVDRPDMQFFRVRQ